MAVDIVDRAGDFAGVNRVRELAVDPEPRAIHWPIVSVDDHLLEPRDTFVGRMPEHLAERAPRIVESNGLEYWQLGDQRLAILGANAPISWSPEDRWAGPVRFDQLRAGTYDVHARVRDMDLVGVKASQCFPSLTFGFAGRQFLGLGDELGHACVRAYNDWIYEAWYGAYPDRFIPCQIPWLGDIDRAVAELIRNAERGFRSVSFSENPQKLGCPSIHTGYWDPFLAACEETETVLNLHVGSSSETLSPSTDSPSETVVSLFQVNAVAAAADWLFSLVTVKFPDIQIALSEGGLGWVPMLLDRLRYLEGRFPERNDGGMATIWRGELTPREALLRNFYFSAIYDPTAFRVLDCLNLDNIMMEVDYPHSDSTWPDSQETIHEQLSGLDEATVRKLTSENAARLYRIMI
jgi:predicted TIM-barrel fold metal-dependent hydrolase